MPRFFVEIPHEGTKEACENAIRLFQETGSHFMTNADWGCEDGEHKAWFILDIEDKESALHIIPPILRRDAKIIRLTKFTMQDVEEIREHHTG